MSRVEPVREANGQRHRSEEDHGASEGRRSTERSEYRDRRVAGRLPRPEPRVASPLLGVARNVLPRPRGRRWRHDGAGLSRHDQPCRRGRCTRSDGDGGHPVHGQGVRRSPQSRGQHRVLAAWRLPMASRAGIHRRAVDRRDARCAVPARGDQRVGQLRVELSRVGILRRPMRS